MFSTFSQKNKSADYKQLYGYAENLYASATATEATDHAAFVAYSQVADLLIKKKRYNDTLVDSYLKCGILQMSKNEFNNSLGYFYQAIASVGKMNRPDDTLLFKPFLYAGTVHYNQNNLDSAMDYYRKAESIFTNNPGLNESERLLNKLGALYYETGDYNKSISYFEKALSIVELKKPVNVFFVINYKNNIATALMKLGKNKKALEIFNELLKFENPADELLFNTGNTYFENDNYAEALKYLRKIRKMDFEKFISLTKIFIRLRQFDSASIYLNNARNLFHDKKNYAPVITHGIIMKYSGDIKAAAGSNLEALRDYQSAIISLDPFFTDTSIAGNPSSFSGLQNFLFLFDALAAKASLLDGIGIQQNNNQYLVQSIHAYRSALSLAKHIEKTYFSDDARLFLKTKVNPATQQAVDVAIELFFRTNDAHYVNMAFSFEENNKATVLQAGLKNLELSSLPDLPANLVSEEKKYRTILARLNIESTLLKDSLSLTVLQLKIHDYEILLAGVQDKLDENPVYHDLKFYDSEVNMDSISKRINGNEEAILSYYYTATKLICFYITKEDAGFSSIPIHESLFATIISLRNELQAPEAAARKNLLNSGKMLFQELLAPVYEKIKDKRRLVIIPFNEISYVPFEMMMNPADGFLLVKKFAISYNYAAGFLTHKNREKDMSYDVLAMAPFTGDGHDDLVLPALPLSIGEISGLPGKKLSGAEAVKGQFISLSGQYPVIHLATHAIANDTNLLGSYIEFYGLKKEADTQHRLYEQEIYTLDLKSARLLILSACETGSGMLVNGEGVISLSRAFSYAGCKSVVTSLWKADENSTSFIGKRLHHYLQLGLPIDEALQKAKIDYLETNEVEERFKNPAYWAHLVLIGDYRSIVEPRFNGIIFLAGIALITLLIFILIKKKTRHKSMPGLTDAAY